MRRLVLYRCVFGCSDRGGCDLTCANYVEYILEKEGDIAAVISEPIRSTPYIPKPEYWQKIREACDRHGTLLILDEIPHSLAQQVVVLGEVLLIGLVGIRGVHYSSSVQVAV